MSVDRPTRVLTVGFILLRYSVVYTVESLSLFDFPFISRSVLLGDNTSVS